MKSTFTFAEGLKEMKIITCGNKDIELLMDLRLEMLKVVNDLSADYEFSKEFVESARNYFVSGNQTTVVAKDGEAVLGCATASYIYIMPTFSHPTGNRMHLMNVYVRKEFQRKGVASKMVKALIEEAKVRGCTEISLDATDSGRPLYESLGFKFNGSAMTLNLDI